MNTKDLAKLYDQLTPRERLPLIIAAGARGDEVEQNRLTASAPKETLHAPNYFRLARGLIEAGHYHLLTLLDLAAQYWQWWGLWMTHGLRHQNNAAAKKSQCKEAKAEDVMERRAGGIVRYFASRFVAHVDGWKQFCMELQIDPEVQLNYMIGWETIVRTEQHVRDLAFSPEEAAGFVLGESVIAQEDDSLRTGPARVETVEELAQGWHVLLEKLQNT